MTEAANKKRGFASMDPAKQRAIASAGGKMAQKNGRAHRWNSEEAKAAGKKGAASSPRTKERMRELGRLGGRARARNAGAHAVLGEFTSSPHVMADGTNLDEDCELVMVEDPASAE